MRYDKRIARAENRLPMGRYSGPVPFKVIEGDREYWQVAPDDTYDRFPADRRPAPIMIVVPEGTGPLNL